MPLHIELRPEARRVYAKALRDGDLIRPDTCTACPSHSHIEGHHEDYSKPLDVEWLCRSCHRKQSDHSGKGKTRRGHRGTPHPGKGGTTEQAKKAWETRRQA